MTWIVLLQLSIIIVVNEKGYPVPVLGQKGANTNLQLYDPTETYYCVYIREIFNSLPDDSSVIAVNNENINLINCSEQYECWRSQLTDRNRQSLIKIYNDYKSDVATGKCPQCTYHNQTLEHKNVFKLTYHWFMELISIHFTRLRPCPLFYIDIMGPIKELEVILNSYGYNQANFNIKDYERGTYIFGITSYLLELDEGQDEAIEKFRTLLNTKASSDIIFSSWPNKTKIEYLLAGTNVFGCSITIRDGVVGITGIGEAANFDRVAFVSCAFASRTKNVFSGFGRNNVVHCRLYSNNANTLYDEETKLCYYPEFEHLKPFDVPCQIYYDYHHDPQLFMKPCPELVPYEWMGVVAPLPKIERIQARVGEIDVVIPIRDRPVTVPPFTTSIAVPTYVGSSGHSILPRNNEFVFFVIFCLLSISF